MLSSSERSALSPQKPLRPRQRQDKIRTSHLSPSSSTLSVHLPKSKLSVRYDGMTDVSSYKVLIDSDFSDITRDGTQLSNQDHTVDSPSHNGFSSSGDIIGGFLTPDIFSGCSLPNIEDSPVETRICRDSTFSPIQRNQQIPKMKEFSPGFPSVEHNHCSTTLRGHDRNRSEENQRHSIDCVRSLKCDKVKKLLHYPVDFARHNQQRVKGALFFETCTLETSEQQSQLNVSSQVQSAHTFPRIYRTGGHMEIFSNPASCIPCSSSDFLTVTSKRSFTSPISSRCFSPSYSAPLSHRSSDSHYCGPRRSYRRYHSPYHAHPYYPHHHHTFSYQNYNYSSRNSRLSYPLNNEEHEHLPSSFQNNDQQFHCFENSMRLSNEDVDDTNAAILVEDVVPSLSEDVLKTDRHNKQYISDYSKNCCGYEDDREETMLQYNDGDLLQHSDKAVSAESNGMKSLKLDYYLPSGSTHLALANPYPKSTVLIFVYGTLKRGYCNHYNLEKDGITYFQNGVTVHPYVMYIDTTNRSRPCLTDGSSCPINELLQASILFLNRNEESADIIYEMDETNKKDTTGFTVAQNPRDENLVCPFCCFRQAQNQKNNTRQSRSVEQPLTVSSEQQTVSSEQQTVSSEQQTVSSEQQTVSSEQQTVSSEQQTVSSEQQVVSSQPRRRKSVSVRMFSSKAWGLPVRGELYRIDASLLPALDRFERVPLHYDRQTIIVRGLNDQKYYHAEVYFNNTSSERWSELLDGRFRLLKDYTMDHHRLYQPRGSNKKGLEKKEIRLMSLLEELRNKQLAEINHDNRKVYN